MKKLLAILMVCGLVFALGACGDEKSTFAGNNIATQAPAANSEIEDYVELVKKTDLFTQSVEQVEAAGMKLDIEVDGNNLVYKYTYTIAIDDNAVEILEQSLQTSEATFKSTADTVRLECPAIDQVVWAYYASDGTFLTSISK